MQFLLLSGPDPIQNLIFDIIAFTIIAIIHFVKCFGETQCCCLGGYIRLRCGSDLGILVYLRLRIGTNNKTCFGPVKGDYWLRFGPFMAHVWPLSLIQFWATSGPSFFAVLGPREK